MSEDKQNERSQVEEWLKKIGDAEKVYAKYYDLVKETREFYKDSKSSRGGKYNIFWSSIETLKPFLYFRQPKFYVERSDKNSGKAEKLACEMLEKALKWDLEQFDFDSVIKYARNDFLISGAGIIWEQYKPKIETTADPLDPEAEITVKSGETVESVYLDPRYFLTDTDRVGVWEDVTWVARKIYMSREKASDEFGESLWKGEDDSRDICIYEVWDKLSGKIFWLSKAVSDRFLKVGENLLNINGFFPCPKPIYATATNDSIIPVPDYCMIREMLNELNGINSRMKLTMQALKVSGAYDNAFPELADILSKDVTLVAVSDFVKLRESGGIRGIVDFAPIEQYVTALEQLALRRQEVIASIFDVTGESDIMRGNSNESDTATAVIKKTNFGTLRNQDRQNDMQRFIRDLLRIKAEIICEMFEPARLASFLDEAKRQDAQTVDAAVNILKTEKLRGMVFSIETDAVFNRDEESNRAIMAVKTINEMVMTALTTVTQQPLLLPLYKTMIEVVVDTLPRGRVFENMLEKVFADVSVFLEQQQKAQELQQQQAALQQPQENPVLAIELQKNQLKAKELEVKEKLEQQRIDLENRQLAAETMIKAQKLELEAKGEVRR